MDADRRVYKDPQSARGLINSRKAVPNFVTVTPPMDDFPTWATWIIVVAIGLGPILGDFVILNVIADNELLGKNCLWVGE